MPKNALFARITRALGWNRSSYVLMSGFVLTLFLLAYVWWPLAEEYLAYIDWQGRWWLQIDRLLLGIFLFMSLMIMAHADLRSDLKIIAVGLVGGLAIESWGTQTELWVYYTAERPPLWIIPAWPIASMTIDRMVRFADRVLSKRGRPLSLGEAGRPNASPGENGRIEARPRQKSRRPAFYKFVYWIIFPLFFLLMLWFVAPTFEKPLTILALVLVFLMILSPPDYRIAVLTFAAGAALGYFLERWGTTRLAWTYYTLEQPPLFAVLAHGMAAVAFWRGLLILERGLAVLPRLPGFGSGEPKENRAP